MKLTGQDIETGLRDWIRTELRDGPKAGYDLGKFLFTVSTGTMGVLLTMEKLGANAALDLRLLMSLGLLFVSALLGIWLALPQVRHLDPDRDELYDRFKARVLSTRRRAIVWFLTWIAGSVLGVIATYT